MKPAQATTKLAAAAAAFMDSRAMDQHPLGASPAVNCCQALVSQNLAVYYPASDNYIQRSNSYWSVAAQLTPWCIVQPTTAQEVSLALTTLLSAAEEGSEQCNIAVRSGGHTTWAGANNIDNGVTIDLGNMNATTYNAETSTASILPGSRWLQVYQTLDALGVTVPGGRAGTVGVAGLVLGGGISFHSAKTGMVCDSVVGYEMVTATGDIIYITKDTYPDLFLALKGGVSNFGIVTRIDLAAFEASQIWGGAVLYNKTSGNALLSAMVDFADNVDKDPGSASLIFWTYLPSLKDIIVIGAFDNTDGVVGAPAFDKYLAAPGILSSSMRLTNISDLVYELEQPAGYSDIWLTLTFKNDKRVLNYAVKTHAQLVKDMLSLSPDGNFITQCLFQPLPTLFAKHGADRGGNVLGLDQKITDNAILLLVTLAVKGAAAEATIGRAKMTAWVDDMEAYAKSVGSFIDWKYINYADITQDPLSSYGAENVARIRDAAAKYDPEGVFQFRVPGGYKISKLAT